jgi:hypothetical protein
MSYDTSKGHAGGVDLTVVNALASLFIAGQRSGDGHMPNFLTGNGLQISIEPGRQVVRLAYQDTQCELSEEEAFQFATMMTAAADALRALSVDQTETSIARVAVPFGLRARLPTLEEAIS